MKNIHITLEDADFEALIDVKGDRTWREAVKEEFGVAD